MYEKCVSGLKGRDVLSLSLFNCVDILEEDERKLEDEKIRRR